MAANYGMGGGNTPLVTEPIAFAQNQRDEVRDLNDLVGALAAEPGMKQQTFIAEPQAFRKSARAQASVENGGYETWVDDGLANTLNCYDIGDVRSTNVAVEPTVIKGAMVGRQDHNGPQGWSVRADGTTYTLNCTEVHAVHEPTVLASGHANAERTVGFSPTLTTQHDGPPIVLDRDVVGSLCARDYKGVGSQYVNEGKVIVAPTLTASNDPSRSPQSSEVTNQVAAVHSTSSAVRRLTPVECERLQGFPDNHTRIAWRGKPAEDCPDSHRYKACGNSMAVPVIAWIGRRLLRQATS